MDETTVPASIEPLLRERRWLRRLATSLVVDAARAEDLTQQALLAALERPPPDADRPRAWLAAVVRNLARKVGTSEQRRAEREQVAASRESLPSTAEVVARAALEHDVASAVLALDEPCRSALLLRFFENLTPRAIAKRTGAPVETVRTRIKRGVELVRAALIERRASESPAVRRSSGDEVVRALVGLLDGGARRAVRRAMPGKGTAVTTTLLRGTSATGVLFMSTKLKLAAAVIVVALGAIAVVTWRNTVVRPADAVGASRRTAPMGVPSAVASNAPPIPVEPTRLAESSLAKPELDREQARTTSSEATTMCVIEGVVHTARGTPASGAVVLLQFANHGTRYFATVEALRRPAWQSQHPFAPIDVLQTKRPVPLPSGVLRTTTAADGTFHFDGLSPSTNIDVAAMHDTEGMVVANGIRVDAATARARVDLTLPESVVLVGVARDRSGRTIRGAFFGMGGTTGSGESLQGGRCEGNSGDDGTFRSLAFPRFEKFWAVCRMDGFVMVHRDFTVPPGEREHRESFTLEPVKVLKGRIVALDGRPAHLDSVRSKLAVWVTESDPSQMSDAPPWNMTGQGKLHAVDDSYETTCERGTEKYVSLWCNHVLLGSSEIVEADVGPELTVDLSRIPPPEPTSSLVLEIVDVDGGKPVQKYDVQLRRDRRETESLNLPPQDLSTHSTDTTGRTVVAGLKLGTYDVEIRSPGLAPRFLIAHVVADPNASPLRVELRPATSWIRGRVVDDHAQPIGDATIVLLAPDGLVAMPSPDCRTVTNDDGQFAFDHVADGDYFVLAEKKGLAPAATAAHDGDENVLLTLGAGVVVALALDVPPHFDAGCQVQIRDEHGIPLYDALRPGEGVIVYGPLSYRLAPAEYTVEVFAAKHTAKPVRFTAGFGAKVAVEVVADESARSRR